MSAIIKVENLSKKYQLGQTHTNLLSERVGNGLRSLYGKLCGRNSSSITLHPSQEEEEFWALRDVSFEVQPGEVVGIIGRNGAGKSTLLKILSRITTPTTGSVELYGRVASLLEVGTGFHPELTGRENVYLNGAILGMSKAEISRKFDEIVTFAEVEKFIDTPVKRYSSGMYVRLAFAVAAHLEPEILIVDEVLAVGDVQFQNKCLGKMEAVGKEGRTVLFVSHNMSAISRLCNKALLLKAGYLDDIGDVRDVVRGYFSIDTQDSLTWYPSRTASYSFKYNSVSVQSTTSSEESVALPADAPFHIVFDYVVSGVLPPGRISFLLTNQEGIVVVCSSNTDSLTAANQSWPLGRIVCNCEIPGQLLAPDRYALTISEPCADGSNIIHENIINFIISEQGSLVARDGRRGVISPVLKWNEEVASK